MYGSEGFSIVLCTHNGRNRLEPTLKHLAQLQMPMGYEAELILVDNASTDNTADFSKNSWLKLGNPYPLRLLTESRPGKGYATELGYDSAKFSYILTVDDDNWLAKDYLEIAVDLFQSHPDVGVLQGQSEGVFEALPPDWIVGLEHYFVIGAPRPESGYFPKDYFFVWGAGMIIQKRDWDYLRSKGFSALTSKLPGKAAGEDTELGLALLLIGRKIYYSEKLNYKHFMPSGRVTWEKLKQNFEVFGYVNHYFFLYSLVLDSIRQNYILTDASIEREFLKYWLKIMSRFTWKQHLLYWLKPQQDIYQLILYRHYSQYAWFKYLKDNALKDAIFLRNWIKPVMNENKEDFDWVINYKK